MSSLVYAAVLCTFACVSFSECVCLCNWVKSLCCLSDSPLGNKHREMSFNPGLELDPLTQLNISVLQDIHTLPLNKSPNHKPKPKTESSTIISPF